MNGNYLLDTNIVIGLFADDKAIVERLAAAESVSVPAVVLGELFFGALNSAKPTDNVARIEQFAAQAYVLDCEETTAKTYGVVKHGLKLKGRPIPENDIWIAALAIQHSMTLISRDKHFSEVDGLQVLAWDS